MKQVEIPLSKKVMLLSFGFLVIGIVFGVLCVIDPSRFATPFSRYGNPIVIFIGGLLVVVVFLPMAVSILRRLLDKTPGLVISKEGITENIIRTTRVPWSDITKIKTAKVAKVNEKYLVIIVKNPQDYIDRETSSFKRSTMKSNYRDYGSPIIIPNSLKMKFDDLHHLLLEKMKEYSIQ